MSVSPAIVRIFAEDRWIGSGFVAGRQLVVTCGHVVYEWDATKLRVQVLERQAAPRFVNVSSKLGRWTQVQGEDDWGEDDWAALRCDEPLLVPPLPLVMGVTPEWLEAWSGQIEAQGYLGASGAPIHAGKLSVRGAKWAVMPSGFLRAAQLDGGVPAGMSGAPVLIRVGAKVAAVGMLILGQSAAAHSFFHGSDVLLSLAQARDIALPSVAADTMPAPAISTRRSSRRWLSLAALVVLVVALSAFVVSFDSNSQLQRAQLALDTGDYPAARHALEPLAQRIAPSTEAKLGLELCTLAGMGDDSTDSQQFERDVMQLQKRSEDTRWAPHVLALRAAKELYAGRLDAAAKNYARAIELRPPLVEARLGLATVQLWQGKLNEAAQQLEAAAHSAPTSPYVRSARAWVAVQRGQISQARSLYREIRHDDPNYLQAHLELAYLEWSNDPREALAILTVAEHLLESDLDTPLNRRAWAYRIGNPAVARASGMREEPALVMFARAPRKRYLFALNTAVTACLAGDAATRERMQTVATKLAQRAVSWADAQPALVLLVDWSATVPQSKGCVQEVYDAARSSF